MLLIVFKHLAVIEKLPSMSLEQRQIFVKIKINFQGLSIKWLHPKQISYSDNFIFLILSFFFFSKRVLLPSLACFRPHTTWLCPLWKLSCPINISSWIPQEEFFSSENTVLFISIFVLDENCIIWRKFTNNTITYSNCLTIRLDLKSLFL